MDKCTFPFVVTISVVERELSLFLLCQEFIPVILSISFHSVFIQGEKLVDDFRTFTTRNICSRVIKSVNRTFYL